MYGAGIFNADEFLEVPVAGIARDVDSVFLLFEQKPLLPCGKQIAGLGQARRLRKTLGGLCVLPLIIHCYDRYII